MNENRSESGAMSPTPSTSHGSLIPSPSTLLPWLTMDHRPLRPLPVASSCSIRCPRPGGGRAVGFDPEHGTVMGRGRVRPTEWRHSPERTSRTAIADDKVRFDMFYRVENIYESFIIGATSLLRYIGTWGSFIPDSAFRSRQAAGPQHHWSDLGVTQFHWGILQFMDPQQPAPLNSRGRGSAARALSPYFLWPRNGGNRYCCGTYLGQLGQRPRSFVCKGVRDSFMATVFNGTPWMFY